MDSAEPPESIPFEMNSLSLAADTPLLMTPNLVVTLPPDSLCIVQLVAPAPSAFGFTVATPVATVPVPTSTSPSSAGCRLFTTLAAGPLTAITVYLRAVPPTVFQLRVYPLESKLLTVATS